MPSDLRLAELLAFVERMERDAYSAFWIAQWRDLASALRELSMRRAERG